MSISSWITTIALVTIVVTNAVDKHLKKKKYKDVWKRTFGDMTVKEVVKKLEELKEENHE